MISMSDDEFLIAFERCTLYRSQWTHEAHLRMAWLYLNRYSLGESIERARNGIRRLNSFFQIIAGSLGQEPKDGYHDTITVAFVRLIASRLKINETFLEFRDRNLDLFDRKLTALLQFYSNDLLHSLTAKEQFTEPNLRKLPV
jgi:hypothetical protein